MAGCQDSIALATKGLSTQLGIIGGYVGGQE